MIEQYRMKTMLEEFFNFYNRRLTDSALAAWSDCVGGYPENAVAESLSEWCRTQRIMGTPADIEKAVSEIIRGKGGSGFRQNPHYDSRWGDLKRWLEGRDIRSICAFFARTWDENPGMANAMFWRMHQWFAEYLGSPERWSRLQFAAMDERFGWDNWSPSSEEHMTRLFALLPMKRPKPPEGVPHERVDERPARREDQTAPPPSGPGFPAGGPVGEDGRREPVGDRVEGGSVGPESADRGTDGGQCEQATIDGI